MTDEEFLRWITGRLINVYGEDENTDFVLRLKAISDKSAPQTKREPLSDEAIRVIVNQLPTEVSLDTGIEFCKIIEKAHGITGDE